MQCNRHDIPLTCVRIVRRIGTRVISGLRPRFETLNFDSSTNESKNDSNDINITIDTSTYNSDNDSNHNTSNIDRVRGNWLRADPRCPPPQPRDDADVLPFGRSSLL